MKMILFLLCLSLSLGQAELITSGLVGYWAGEGNALDGSSLHNNGNYVGDGVYTTGKFGQAFLMDGNDYVEVTSSSLAMTSAMSISMWLKPTTNSTEMMLFNREGEYEMYRATNGNLLWAFANSSPGWAYIDTGVVATLNTWTHITVTYAAGLVKTYVNGSTTPYHTYNGSGNIGDYHTDMQNFRIGSRQGGFQPNFQGAIDEVLVYNRALTATEAASLYAGVSVSVPEPATWALLLMAGLFFLRRKKS